MKKLTLTLFVILFSTISSFAEIKFPRESFDHTKIKEAVKKATDTKKPLVFIETDMVTTCPKCHGSTNDFIDAVGRRGIIVRLNSRDDVARKNLNAPVLEALRNLNGGVPVMVIVSPADNKVIGTATYKEYTKDPKATLKNVEKTLRTYKNT